MMSSTIYISTVSRHWCTMKLNNLQQLQLFIPAGTRILGDKFHLFPRPASVHYTLLQSLDINLIEAVQEKNTKKDSIVASGHSQTLTSRGLLVHKGYPPITHYCTGLLILDHSYLVGNLTKSKIAETKTLEPLES